MTPVANPIVISATLVTVVKATARVEAEVEEGGLTVSLM